jgi:nucleoside-diphosphate-sugar epimerase
VKRVLVTGATGFVGRQALGPLQDRSFEIHAMARGPQPETDVTWHAVDLLDAPQLERIVSEVRATHLLHLAWYAVHGSYWRSPENLRWVEASSRLVRAFRDAGGSRVVIAGTCAEYDWNSGLCREDVTPMRPQSLYGVAKDALHRIVAAYGDEVGMSMAWGRIFFSYGPHENPDRLVASVIRSLLAGAPAAVTEGNQARDFLHVADVGSAFAALLDSDVDGPVNIASGEAQPVREVVKLVGDIVGRPELLRFGALPTPVGEPPVLAAAVRRLRDEVGWRPDRTLAAGLAETVDWWRGLQEPGNRAASTEGAARDARAP